jgi:hypothetical protein
MEKSLINRGNIFKNGDYSKVRILAEVAKVPDRCHLLRHAVCPKWFDREIFNKRAKKNPSCECAERVSVMGNADAFPGGEY